MPAYHSSLNDSKFPEACQCALCPIKTEVKGPAALCPTDEEDIIDEVLNYFRANVFFRNFEIKGAADRSLIYLTLHCVQVLVKMEKIEDKATAIREIKQMSTKQFPAPGDESFVLAGMFPLPSGRADVDSFRAYFKQAREELGLRIVARLFDGPSGEKNKWWQSFSKRKFMGKELKDV